MILQINNLSHAYSDGVSSLQEINLNISRGQKVSILGPSGCGKSTLLRLIAGLEEPGAGEIIINGFMASKKNYLMPPEKRKIGLVVQEKALFPHLSVYENICFGIKQNKNKNSISLDLLELLKIDTLKDKYPHEISGGEQQRVALARSLAPNPELLMLDEPFSALDESLKETLYVDISKVFLERNSTILLVTHDTKEAEIMTDIQLRMEKGKLV
tara:strand:- start:4350 stop:4991 length:642 start_codon:yes stop_codon:yes gene_type:complete